MTSLYFDPALLEGPSDPEPREQLIVNGRYYLPPLDDPTGKRRSLQRVTNFIKQLSEQGGLTTWKLRSAVIGLARDERRYDLACSINPDSPRGKQELDQLIEECIDFANAGPSGGNITGTALHNYTDDVAGSYPIRVRDKWVPKLENYFTALHNKGLRVVPGLQERLVVSERYGTCGRLDDVYEDPFGTLRVGDRKSQKDFQTWWEVGAQLALYQGSDAMWNEAECRFEDMPALADDFCHVAWMPLNHPAAKKGGDVDTVTIYDIPLAGPREVLEWCLRVRTLRTQARQWGQERPDLDAFAVTARDIRDAETHDELRKIAANRTSATWSGELHQVMAERRWEELAAAPKPEPVSVSIEDAAFVGGSTVPHSPIQVAKNQAQWAAEREAVTPPTSHPAAVSAEYVRNMTPEDVAQTLNGPGPLSQEEIERRRADVFDRLRREAPLHHTQVASAEPVIRPVSIVNQGTVSAEAVSDVRNFAFESAPRLVHDVTGLNQHPMERLPLLQDVVTFDPALFVGPEQEEATFLPADMELIEQAAGQQAHPIATTQFTHSQHANTTVVELPDDEEISIIREERAVPTLDAVPIKIVREVCTRANNSQSSRGRVRLLNDLGKKYAQHQDVLLSALLREWLTIDGGPTSMGAVKLTEGSSRSAMGAKDAGPVSLTDYLATREAPKSGTEETEAAAPPVPDRDAAPTNVTNEVAAKIQAFADDVAEIRKPYQGLTEGPQAGRHSILRLIELAKDAASGGEREKVFHAITKYHTWTGELAAEINQHYLDAGQATVDFDPYFVAQQDAADDQVTAASALPLDPDDPATAQDALHLLEGVESRDQLTLMWSQLATKSYFQDQALQEGLLAKMMSLKK